MFAQIFLDLDGIDEMSCVCVCERERLFIFVCVYLMFAMANTNTRLANPIQTTIFAGEVIALT
jgi:hypothetical protein